MNITKCMSPKTVIKQIKNGNDKFWIVGIKVNKYFSSGEQHVSMEYVLPQEAIVNFNDTMSRGDNSITGLEIKSFIATNSLMSCRGLKLAKFGIRFFKDRDSAEHYFLKQSRNISNTFRPVINVCDELVLKFGEPS